MVHNGLELQSAGVFEDEAELKSYAKSRELELEPIEIPSGRGRDAFLKKWATAAKKKNKRGLIPFLLLPLAACGGGDDEPLLEAFSGTIADAKALDTSKYTADFDISVSDAGQVSAEDLNALAAQTGGDVTSTGVTSVSGTASQVQAAVSDTQLLSLDAVDVAVTDQPTLAELKAINAATSGTITLDVRLTRSLARLMIWLRRLLVR